RRRHTRFSRDWSSDVCSSDLELRHAHPELDFGMLQIRRAEAAADEAARVELVPACVTPLGRHRLRADGYAPAHAHVAELGRSREIGRASWRERGERTMASRTM